MTASKARLRRRREFMQIMERLADLQLAACTYANSRSDLNRTGLISAAIKLTAAIDGETTESVKAALKAVRP